MEMPFLLPKMKRPINEAEKGEARGHAPLKTGCSAKL